MRKEPQFTRLDFNKSTNPVSSCLPAVQQSWRIFISNLRLMGFIGIYPAEKAEPQMILINVSVTYWAEVPQDDAAVEQVVCYQSIVTSIEQLVLSRHIMFVENLAEEIAQLCLLDLRVSEVIVRVEKPDAIKEVTSVGVEIIRKRPNESITLMR